MIKPKVLFICSGNSARTQMAEAFLRETAGDRFETISAGGEASPLDPDAVEAMRELGTDISGHQYKSVDNFLGERFAIASRGARVPIFPGAIWREQWNLNNPAWIKEPEDRRQPFGSFATKSASTS